MTTIVLFSAVAVTLALLLISLYFAFKNWLLGSVSVGYRQKKAKIWLALHRIFGNFISSAAQGFGWILTLAVFIALSCLISYFEIKYIDGTDVLIAQLSCLAIATTALYLSWSIWTAWQTGYWSGIIENNALDEGLQYARVDESSSWQFFGLTVLCTFVVLSCFVGSLMYSDKLINLLTTISKNIPDKLQINLPKPQ